MPSEARKFEQPQQLLDYLVTLLGELRGMSAPDFPSVSRHIQAAEAEAERLKSLRG